MGCGQNLFKEQLGLLLPMNAPEECRTGKKFAIYLYFNGRRKRWS